jgi:hypothetical protein
MLVGNYPLMLEQLRRPKLAQPPVLASTPPVQRRRERLEQPPLVDAETAEAGRADEAQANRIGAEIGRDLGAVSVKGGPLSESVRAVAETHLGVDLSGTELRTDARANERAAEERALALTEGSMVSFSREAITGSSNKQSALLGHELTHVAQQRSAGRRPGESIQRQNIQNQPQGERTQVTVARGQFSLSEAEVDKYFERTNAGRLRNTVSLPPGMAQVRLIGIPAAFEQQMIGIASDLRARSFTPIGTQNELRVLRAGSSVAVDLKLRKHGLADGSYRFTWVGTTLFIEALTPVAQQNEVTSDILASSVVMHVGQLRFVAVGLLPEELAPLQQALQIIPQAALTFANDLYFRKVTSKPPPPGDQAGDYDEASHTVRLYAVNKPLASSSQRIGTSAWPVQVLVHEIGHAVDLRSRTDLPGFRDAAARDDVRARPAGQAAQLRGGPTDYSNVDWLEMYAESFMLYVTDPGLLRAIRPNIHAFMDRVAQFHRR